jgi:hypothetical protein
LAQLLDDHVRAHPDQSCEAQVARDVAQQAADERAQPCANQVHADLGGGERGPDAKARRYREPAHADADANGEDVEGERNREQGDARRD